MTKVEIAMQMRSSGLKAQIAYSQGGVMEHDLVKDFRNFHKTAEE